MGGSIKKDTVKEDNQRREMVRRKEDDRRSAFRDRIPRGRCQFPFLLFLSSSLLNFPAVACQRMGGPEEKRSINRSEPRWETIQTRSLFPRGGVGGSRVRENIFL